MARKKAPARLQLVFASDGKAVKELHPVELDHLDLEPLRYGRRRLVPAVRLAAPDLGDRAVTVDQIWLQLGPRGKPLAKLDLPNELAIGGAAAAEFPAFSLIFTPEA